MRIILIIFSLLLVIIAGGVFFVRVSAKECQVQPYEIEKCSRLFCRVETEDVCRNGVCLLVQPLKQCKPRFILDI